MGRSRSVMLFLDTMRSGGKNKNSNRSLWYSTWRDKTSVGKGGRSRTKAESEHSDTRPFCQKFREIRRYASRKGNPKGEVDEDEGNVRQSQWMVVVEQEAWRDVVEDEGSSCLKGRAYYEPLKQTLILRRSYATDRISDRKSCRVMSLRVYHDCCTGCVVSEDDLGVS